MDVERSIMPAITVISPQSASDDLSDEKGREPEPPAEWKPSRRVKLIFLGQIFVVLAISLDMTILTVSLPTVAENLEADVVSAFWIAASYLLANAVVQPLMAALADIFGRLSVNFTSLALFTIGSIICSVARNVPAMLVGRTIQGIGGGGVLSVNLIIIADLIPLRFRPKYISCQQLCVFIGFNIAPIIGGVIVKYTTWRWLFYINFPLCAIGLLLIPFLLRYERPPSTINDQFRKVDWVGSMMFIVGMTTFLMGTTWAGTQYAWDSSATLVPIVLGAIVVFATALYEHFIATVHFLRLSLFASWSAIAIYTCTTLQTLTLFAKLYFMVLYFITVRLYTPLEAGIYILAFSLVCIPASGIAGPVIQRLGRYRWAIWSGWLINTIALGVLVLLDVHTSTVAWVLMSVTAGVGQGILFIAHPIASQAACQQKDAAHATSMFSFFRSLGLCFGVAIGGTVFQNFLVARLTAQNLPAIAKNAEAFAAVLREMPADAVKEGIISAYAWSFQKLFATLCGISGVGLIISCFIAGHSLDQKHETAHKLRSETPPTVDHQSSRA